MERCEHSSSAPLVVPCSGQTPEGSLTLPGGTQGCPALPPALGSRCLTVVCSSSTSESLSSSAQREERE